MTSIDRTALDSGLRSAEALRAAAQSVAERAGVDRLELSGTGVVGRLPLLDALGLGADGHLLDVTVMEGDWRLRIRAEGDARPSVETEGPAEQALEAAAGVVLDRALANQDAAGALRLVAGMHCEFRLIVRHDAGAAGGHWAASLDALAQDLSGPNWVRAASVLGSGPRVVVADDAAVPFAAGQFVIRGPDATGPMPTAAPVPDDRDYRRWRERGDTELPSPMLFAPSSTADSGAGPTAARLLAVFGGVTRLLVWWWLADSASMKGGGTEELTFRGARIAKVTLRPEPVGDVADEVLLYQWAAASIDPARVEAVQQAASWAIGTADDVATAAEPVFRTARSLFEIARRGAVSEALATRRTARDSALGAARDASGTAREAATKTVERVVVQIGAAVAILLARTGEIVSRAGAVSLLLTVGVICAVSMVVALRVDLNGAERSLEAELEDLAQYRDTLSTADIDAIRGVAAVARARATIKQARRAARAIYLTAIIAIVSIAAAIALRAENGSSSDRPGPPGSTTSTPDSSTTTSARTSPLAAP